MQREKAFKLRMYLIAFKIDFEAELQRLLKGLWGQTLSGRVVTPPKTLNRK